MAMKPKHENAARGPVIILVEPQIGENIGTAARAMANFGLTELRLVAPRDDWPNEKAVAAAAGAHNILDDAKLFETLEAAIADIHRLFATTARPRDMIKRIIPPDDAIAEMQQLNQQNQKTGVLFGRERFGLSNDEIALADTVIMAPVDPDFASLNLAQAVLVIAYEWMKQNKNNTLGRTTEFDGPSVPGLQMKGTMPATKQELIAFFEHLEGELDKSGFLRPLEKRPIMIRNLRNMFQRMEATEQEIRTLRGVVASLTRVHKQHKNLP